MICHAAGWPSLETHQQQSRQHYLEPSIDLINRAIEWRIKRFVNLSSITVTRPAQRNDPLSEGKPRRHASMINCLIAVENFLQAHASEQFSVVNLRCGIYSGKQLSLGVLPALLSRISNKALPQVSGRYGYLPLVDGRDIAQAFTRAALAPALPSYESINILGPEVPSQADIYNFLQREFKQAKPVIKLPAGLLPLYSIFTSIMRHNQQAFLPRGFTDFLINPSMDNKKSAQMLGYNPEIHWTASLQDSWLALNNHSQAGSLSKFINTSEFNQ